VIEGLDGVEIAAPGHHAVLRPFDLARQLAARHELVRRRQRVRGVLGSWEHVIIGLAGPELVLVRQFNWKGDRWENRRLSVEAALNLVLESLVEVKA